MDKLEVQVPTRGIDTVSYTHLDVYKRQEHAGRLIDHGQRERFGRCDDARGDIVLVHGNRNTRRRCV